MSPCDKMKFFCFFGTEKNSTRVWCVFIISIDRANRLTNEKTSVPAGKNQGPWKGAKIRKMCNALNANANTTLSTWIYFM